MYASPAFCLPTSYACPAASCTLSAAFCAAISAVCAAPRARVSAVCLHAAITNPAHMTQLMHSTCACKRMHKQAHLLHRHATCTCATSKP